MQNMRVQHSMGTLNEQTMDRMQEKSDQQVNHMSCTMDGFRKGFKAEKRAGAGKRNKEILRSMELRGILLLSYT